MTVIERNLIEKLQQLPAQRQAEVADFVEFLVSRESRAVAAAHLGESLARLDSLKLSPITDEDIDAEIQAVRAQRKAAR